ncbi:MAG TPA: type II secretion system protein [Candidatus Acidoferrum sp.]|nr:type II secretion system protein [Candidatus Acidoferrum sp.]
MSTRITIGMRAKRTESGMTLLELIIACAILLILAGAALPIARRSIRYQKEAELRRDLREMKDSIDRYKDAADKNLIRVEVGSEGYPPDLETLVNGVNVGATSDKKVRFLRSIPIDPMTGQKDWGKRCVSDDTDSTSWCGKNVFDVYSNSHDTGTDGRPYSEW